MGTEETDGGCGAASDTQAEQDHKPDDAEPAAKAQRTGTSTLPALAHGGGFGSLASQSSSAFATQPSNDADAALGTSMPHVPQLFHGTSNGEAADNNDGHDDSKNAESSQQDGNALTGEKTTESENAANTVAMPGEAESTGEEDEESLLEAQCILYEFNAPPSESNQQTEQKNEGSTSAQATPPWKGRGRGTLHMNQRADGSSARLVMRREGNLRLVLNAALYRGMTFARMDGSKGVTFVCINGADGEKSCAKTFALRFIGSGAQENMENFIDKAANFITDP